VNVLHGYALGAAHRVESGRGGRQSARESFGVQQDALPGLFVGARDRRCLSSLSQRPRFSRNSKGTRVPVRRRQTPCERRQKWISTSRETWAVWNCR
jgi:hypothetical protein